MAHTCHARDCKVEVPPEKLMCLKHWRMVPGHMQNEVWKHYRNGQCDDKCPSREWIKAAKAAIEHVYLQEQRKNNPLLKLVGKK